MSTELMGLSWSVSCSYVQYVGLYKQSKWVVLTSNSGSGTGSVLCF